MTIRKGGFSDVTIRKWLILKINSRQTPVLSETIHLNAQITSSKAQRTQTATVERQHLLNTPPQETHNSSSHAEVLSVVEIGRLRELEEKWEARSTIFRHSTSSYQQLQRRFLWVLAIAAEERTEEFEAFRDKHDWTATTTAFYWNAVIAASKTLDIQVTYAMRTAQKWFQFIAKEEDAKRPTTPITKDQVELAALALNERLGMAIRLCFQLGQRIGDTLQLTLCNIGSVTDAHTNTEFTTIMYKRGKTTRRRDPFTLHLEYNSQLAKDLRALVEKGRTASTPWTMLFTSDRELAANLIRMELKKVSSDLCLLSLRRGGLIAMAQGGASISTLLHHSRHASDSMLARYLNWGTYNFTAARELMQLAGPSM
ncbi:MAG: site-specific integrase [Bdellovibrionales bacterium]|nr:site-specific integrase [Bdellovibrionales bacterium]